MSAKASQLARVEVPEVSQLSPSDSEGSEDGAFKGETPPSEYSPGEMAYLPKGGSSTAVLDDLLEIFEENVAAKMVRVAMEALENNNPPTAYPEFVPQHSQDAGKYVLREADFWTCGFFPGILYLLLERAVKYPHVFPCLDSDRRPCPIDRPTLRKKLISLCRDWTQPMRAMASRTDTHDMGFMFQPAFRTDWELTGSEQSLEVVMTAARSLASRYNAQVGAIRSWDALRQSDVSITSLTDDFLVIIDSMCNLDLLFYASKQLSDPKLAEIATTHARTLLKSHLRPEAVPNASKRNVLYSTCHVVNFDPRTGKLKEHRTAQGYNKSSTWARGQAWGIVGYAQTYMWTKDKEFLDAACGLADYFLWRLKTAPACVEVPYVNASGAPATMGRNVPLWDFDAPIEDETKPLRDSSAGVIAANGMLLLSQAFAGMGNGSLSDKYRRGAMTIVSDTLKFSLSTEKARFTWASSTSSDAVDPEGVRIEDSVAGRHFDSILKNATANHNPRDPRRYGDHGLVYADYYLLEFGNKLLRMGLI